MGKKWLYQKGNGCGDGWVLLLWGSQPFKSDISSFLDRAVGSEIGHDFDPRSTKLDDIMLFRQWVTQFQTAHNVGTCQRGVLCETTLLAIKSCIRQSLRHTF